MKSFLVLIFIAFSLVVNAQSYRERLPFNGVVKDILDKPIKGVRVWHKDSRRYATSDRKGRFGLTDVHAEDTIHLRYRKVQYDIPVEGKKSLSIKLADQIQAEEDSHLVDLGYGYVSQRECTISRGGISGDELRRSGKTNILAALEGRIAGLNIQTSGTFGTDATVNIRGISSIHLSSEPLYVVDGVVVPTLDNVSVYDVDYVEVLKEGSIYGARGANGVILVHTIR